MNYFRLVLIAFISLTSSLSLAGRFDKIGYGGRLAQPDGTAITGPVNLDINLYSLPTGTGNLLTTKSFTNVKLDDGVFEVDLGDVRSYLNGDVWVEVKDVTNGEVYPRHKFAAVPFALRIPIKPSGGLSWDGNGNLKVNFPSNSGFAADGTVPMTGGLNMSNNSITNVGSLEIADQKTLGLGAYDNSQEAALTALLSATDEGKTWFNSDSNEVKFWNGSATTVLGVAGSGLANFNGQTGTTQSLDPPGTSGNAPNWSSTSNSHTLNIPMANAGGSVTAGLISNAEHVTFAGKANDSDVLKKDGSVALTNHWDVGAKKITNLAAPAAAGDAATMAYVDTNVATKENSAAHTATMWCASNGAGNQIVCNKTAPVLTESDPNVTAFAKTALPTCGAGQLLKGDGTTLSCVTDAGITAETDPGLQTLNASEIDQLETIGSTTVTSTQWGYLGAMAAQPLESIDWTTPGTIGSSTPNTGKFSTLSAAGPVDIHNPGGSARLKIVSFANKSEILGERSNGSPGAESVVLDGEDLFQIRGNAWNGSIFAQGARINFVAGNNWSGGDHSTIMKFETAKDAETTLSERMRIHDNGFVGIGMQTPSEMLEVNGKFKTNHGYGVIGASTTSTQMRMLAVSLQTNDCTNGSGNWEGLSAANNGNTNECQISFTPNFGDTPVCTCSMNNGPGICNMYGSGPSGVILKTFDSSGSPAQNNWASVICYGKI